MSDFQPLNGPSPRFRGTSARCVWGLYGIIDSAMAGRSHADVCAALVRGGARVIQLRDKAATFEELLDIGAQVRTITREAGVTLLVNDNPYLAREIDADGVHIGQEDFPADIVREVMGEDKIVGLSTHSKQQAIAALTLPIDYIGVGPIYGTNTKQSTNVPVGTSLLRWVRQHIPLPSVAIGGITTGTIPDVLAAGATNVAMIGELMRATDIAAKTAEACALVDQYADWK